jgi:hypothetical protein
LGLASDLKATQWLTLVGTAVNSTAFAMTLFYVTGSFVNMLYFFIAFGIALTVGCYCAPEGMQAVMSMPETFRFENNFGPTALELQSVTYEAYHTTFVAQASHHTFLTDSIMWGALSWRFGPVGPCVLVAFGFLQGRSFQRDGFARLLAAFWLFCVGAGFMIHMTGFALEIASVVLVVGALIKVTGHAVEPVPPGILAPTFSSLETANISDTPKLAGAMIAGYFAEFFSGLPWRLPAIWLYIGLLHWTPFSTDQELDSIMAQAVQAHQVKPGKNSTGGRRCSWEVVPSYDTVVGNRIANVYSIAAVAMLIAALNLYMTVGLVEHLCCLPADVYAGVLFVLSGMFIVLIVDPACLGAMFFPTLSCSSRRSTYSDHPFAQYFKNGGSLQIQFVRAMCALNWSAGYGVLCAAARISVSQRVQNYNAVVFPTQDILHDLATGEIEINALLRSGTEKSWENKYGLLCAFYFYGVLSATVISRAIEGGRFAALKIMVFLAGGICMAVCGQFFTRQNLPAGVAMLVFDALWIWHLIQGQLKSDSESTENAAAERKSQ